MDSDDHSTARTQVEDLWFSADVIVVQAGSKIFQVSSAILAARSTVFRDMIGFPQPDEGGTDNLNGTPLVFLHDSPEHVEVFLRAIFDSSFFMPPPTQIELSVVLAILRLSHKYDIPYLHRRALAHLTASGWCPSSSTDTSGDHIIADLLSPQPSLDVILAATEVGATWLLPWAYYATATYTMPELLALRTGAMEHHVQKALLAQTALTRGTIAVNRFLMAENDGCATPAVCRGVRTRTLTEVFDNVQKANDLDPFGEWNSPKSNLETLKAWGMCESCFEQADVQHQEAISTFWDSLPNIFALPPWDELHAMQQIALAEDTKVAGG
ncbi:hypothetical protein C8R43DRAFT_1004470 [Mycena crocata]|nr:hypothetical protein C8R43DRAFT_1004470 [Mycena crocata]